MPIDKVCQHCQKPFRVQPKYDYRKYCGTKCHRAHEAIHGRPAAQVAPLQFICKECSKPFLMERSYVTAYHKKWNRDPMYCSMQCSATGRRKDADERHKTNCKNCGNEFYKTRRKGSGNIYNTQQLCSKQCKNEWVSKVYREKHGSPEISRREKRNYIELRIPPRDGEPVRFILEHRYVMEQQIGRRLRTEETVHHKNGDRHNNSIQNLELFSSRHGPGQRVVDKIAFAIEMLQLYPEFGRAAGFELKAVEHITDAPCDELRQSPD